MNEAQKQITAEAVSQLRRGEALNGIAATNCGRYAEHIEALEEVLSDGGPEAVETVLDSLCRADDCFAELAEEAEREEPEGSDPLPWRPFPLEALPNEVTGYVKAHAAALNVAPAMIALPSLAVLAAAVGNSCRIQLKKSWREPATIWTIILGRSGTRKSPALDAALQPVYALQAQLNEMFEQARARFDALSKEEQEEAEEPKRTRLRVGDTTAESVVAVHAENERGLLLGRDELGAWLGSFDRYASGEADLQNWLETYEGRPLVIDRKSSSAPVLTIKRPAVCVAGGIQPGVLRKKLTEEHFASGFAARLLMAKPPEKERRWSEADVHEETREGYHRLVQRMYGYDGAGGITYEEPPAVLEITPAAKDHFASFVNSNAAIQREMPDGALRSLLSKIEAVAARLALILQVAADPEAEAVSEEAMKCGIDIAEWLRYEAARIYQREGFERGAQSRDERLAAELPDTFAWQDVAETWGVQKSGAFKIINRLTEERLIKKVGHGKYERKTPWDTVDFGHFGHFTRGISR